MLKNRTKLTFAALSLCLVTFLSSCYSSQQFVQPSLTQKVSAAPQYLSNLSINGPERSLTLTTRRPEPHVIALEPAIGKKLKSRYAEMLNVVPEALCNLSLYNFIDQWYGVRYRLGGNSKKGIDCSAFVQRAYEQ